MKFIEVSHLEFDTDRQFGEDWSEKKQRHIDELEQQYCGIYGGDGTPDDMLDDIAEKAGFDIRNCYYECLSTLDLLLKLKFKQCDN